MHGADGRVERGGLVGLGAARVRRVAVLADPQLDVVAEAGLRHVAAAHERERLDDLVARRDAGPRRGRPDEARVDLEPDVRQRAAERRRGLAPDVLPEAAVAVGRPAPHDVEAEIELRAAEPLELLARDDHAAHQRVDDPVVRAVGRVRRDRQVRLVGDREAGQRGVRADRANRLADEGLEAGDVALPSLGRVVAQLHLAAQPRAAVPVDVGGEAADRRGAVGPEQPVEAQDEVAPGRPHLLQRGDRPRIVDRPRRLLQRSGAARHAGGDPEAQRRGGLRDRRQVGGQAVAAPLRGRPGRSRQARRNRHHETQAPHRPES
jgi:hypothetical protein